MLGYKNSEKRREKESFRSLTYTYSLKDWWADDCARMYNEINYKRLRKNAAFSKKRGRLFKCRDCRLSAHRDAVGSVNIELAHGIKSHASAINRAPARPSRLTIEA